MNSRGDTKVDRRPSRQRSQESVTSYGLEINCSEDFQVVAIDAESLISAGIKSWQLRDVSRGQRYLTSLNSRTNDSVKLNKISLGWDSNPAPANFRDSSVLLPVAFEKCKLAFCTTEKYFF